MRLFPFTFWQHKQPEPVVVETPPAVEEKIPEERLRAMFRLGVNAGYKQAREEEEQKQRAKIASLSTLRPAKPAQPVLQMPVQAVQEPLQQPIPLVRRAGGWMHAGRAVERVAAKTGQSIIPVRPKPHNVPTIADMPVARKLPDAG